MRKVNNPVRYAFRDAGLVRGADPYALITDDIQKDDATDTYRWLMQLKEDLYIEHQEHSGNVRDIVLAEKNGDRRLLVRVLDQDTGQPAAFSEHYPTEYKLQGNLVNRPAMYRLTVPTKTAAYHSRVLLYPLRKEPLPAIQWDAGTGKAQLTEVALHDELDFTASADGRTKIRILRAGQTISQTKQRTARSPIYLTRRKEASMSTKPIRTLCIIGLLCSTAFAQTLQMKPADSPFKDKVAESYSDAIDPITHEARVLQWGDLKPSDFGPSAISFDDSGLRPLPAVPPPGVHPRILFGPDEVPRIRQRWHDTTAGRIMYGHMQAWSAALRGHYNDNAPYAKPDI